MACQYNALISYRLHSFSCLRCCLKTQASIETQLPIHDAGMIYDFGVRHQHPVQRFRVLMLNPKASPGGTACKAGLLLIMLRSLCDEKHTVFECSALQGLRDEYASLFSDMCTMKQFLYSCCTHMYMHVHACGKMT